MGFNPFCNSKITKLTKSGAVGRVEHKRLYVKKGEKVESPFTIDELIGKTITTTPNMYRLVTPKKRPAVDEDFNIFASDYDCFGAMLYYTDLGGSLDKKILFVEMANMRSDAPINMMLQKSPVFYQKYADYHALIYAYEPTNALTLGGSFEPGWYALNMQTYAIEAVDIKNCPVYFPDALFDQCGAEIVNDYFYSATQYEKTLSFTLAEEYLWRLGDDASIYFINKGGLTEVEANEIAQTYGISALYNGVIQASVRDMTIHYETIHPIDPKFIPGAVLPVVEIATVPTAEGALLTAEEIAMLEKAAAQRVPAIIRFGFSDEERFVAVGILLDTSTPGYIVPVGVATMVFGFDGENWTAIVQ